MTRLGTVLRGLGLAAVVATCLPAPKGHADGWVVTAYLPTGNAMASGDMPFSGAAACSYRWPLGTTFRMWDGAVYVCLDRGLLDEFGVDLDIFAWSYGEALWLQARYSGTTPVALS